MKYINTVWNIPMRVADAGFTDVEIETVDDPDGLALTTSRTYSEGVLTGAVNMSVALLVGNTFQFGTPFPELGVWSNYTFPCKGYRAGAFGKPVMTEYPDGRWERNEYDDYGRRVRHISSWLDAPKTADANQARRIEYSYQPVDANDSSSASKINWPDILPYTARTVAESVLGVVVAKTFYAFYNDAIGRRVEIEERAASAEAPYGAAGNLRTTRIYYSPGDDAALAGKLKAVTYPDGRVENYTYEFGTFQANADPAQCSFTPGYGPDVRETKVHGTIANPDGIANKTVKEVVVRNAGSRELLQETYVCTGGSTYSRIAWTVSSLDALGRPIHVYKSDGTQVDTTWACCGKESEKDANGVEHLFAYDALKRLEFVSKVGVPAGTYPVQADIYTTYTYDAAGRQIKMARTAGSLSQVTSNEYDLAGRLTKTTDEAGLTTVYTYSTDGLAVAETLPGGFTRITERFKDGQIKAITGTAAPAQYYEYGVNADGTRWTKVATGAAGGPVWQKTTTDLLGRTAKVEKPGYSTTEVTENFYNNKGQLVRQSTADGLQSLFAYDELGNQIRSGSDADANGVLDLAGMDRISESDTSYNLVSGIWYLESVSRIYATDNNATPLANSITREKLTGLGGGTRSVASALDAYGNETVTTTVDRDSKLVTQTTDTPTSTSNMVAVSVNGLLQSSTTAHGLQPTVYSYDSLSRRTRSETSGGTRSVASVSHYDSHGWIDYTEDAAGNRTTFSYDSATGRRLSQTDALGNTTYFAYSAFGSLERTWGSASYPVLYEYDGYGRMTRMNTYRAGSGWSGSTWPASPGAADTTTWTYHEPSGLLTAKTDAAGKSVTYTYTGNSKLEIRNWARKDGTNDLVTTYSYNSAGDLTAIDYSDNTPDVSLTYDRLGRQITASSSISAHTFAYNGLLLDTETIVSSAGTNVIDRSYDSLGRSSGFSVAGDADPGYSVAYGYDSFGRFSSVSSSVSSVSISGEYSYLADSDLISGLQMSGGLSVTRTFEQNRNLLTQVKNQVDSETISQFDYANDALGRRTSIKHSGSAFETGPAFNKYDYNSRSEVTVGDKFWGANLNDTGDPVLGQGFAYAYDNIGNRTASSRDNEESIYTANNLNQYNQRTVADLIDIIGVAETNVTVTVNDLPTSRHEKYWHRGLDVTNDSSAVWQEVNVVGVYNPPGTSDPEIVSSETGHVFVAKTPEQFTYDDDGNMLSDGRFNYSWDCENRLIAAETLPDLPTSVPRQQLVFAYDYMGRRVGMAVYERDNNHWQPWEWRTFVWDGWNVVAEKTIAYSDKAKIKKGKKKAGEISDKGALTSVCYYAWGLDLSGTLQGAGGVGGLLASSTHSSDGGTNFVSSVFYTFDANGNVSELLDADNGTNVRAHYEYSPFGETLVSVGDLAKENTFRFSTKYFDQESGLYYYGYRYYSPSLGRWLSRDPIGEIGGENLYCFVGNTPVNLVDIFGLVDWRTQSTQHPTDLGAMGSAGNVQSYPGGPQWAYGVRTLAVAGADWTVRVFCRCSEERGQWVISYVRVVFTPVVHYRTNYESDEQRRWVREREQDHVGDYRWWARNEGEPLVANFERGHFGDTFADKQTCVNTLQPQVGPLLTTSFATIVGRTIRSWDDTGQHTWPPPPAPPRGNP